MSHLAKKNRALPRLLTQLHLAACCGLLALSTPGISLAETSPRSGWPGAGQLFVGTCYQPVDRSRAQIQNDIALMRQSGFKVVRMGDLAWDYFEPADGKFAFQTFDWIMDQMHAAGIRVILDIAGLPAPLWLHHKYPGVDLVTQQGTRLDPAERYMDNISDPDYKRLVKRFADTLTRRYAKHPALLAIGFDNEIGNGYMSYSEADRKRFIGWLQKKYGNLDALNQAWATQRWSRRIGAWDEVRLPYADGPGPFERQLDLRRYWSDVTIDTLRDLSAIRRKNTPDKPAISNLWDSAGRKGFDYLSTYRDYADYGAMGFYPGEPVGAAFEALMMKAGMTTPIWFNEFTAGGPGFYGTKGRSRMWAHFGLLLGAQAVLAWTYNSHLGGEEQALFGLLDHDDRPSWKLGEFATIAADFDKLQKLGFPRLTQPKVAIAYSFDNAQATNPLGPSSSNSVRQYLTTPYLTQAHNAFAPLLKDNIDVAVINIAHEDLSRYSLLIIPGMYLLDPASADAVRRFVEAGGTAIMTAYSAKVDQHNQWYASPLPGRLTDVFGLRTNEFYNGGTLLTRVGGEDVKSTIGYYEVLEPSTAQALARFSNVDGTPPAVTVNQFGKGRAIYVATPAQPQLMQPLYRQLYDSLGIVPGPKTPDGVYARAVDGRVLYVNTTSEAKEVPLAHPMNGVLSGQQWAGSLRLPALGVDLLEQ
ncbi:beta-galactosidase [Duganella sp. FT134W]|uniref:beta-galactosidase n=1 Tax=Duganella margarita TaxID=2692170 RepID=A0A7X4GYQ0_9BURK|nr:beta-galactosidase [Duganella margarita]MYM71039.1 beta-galactosidase [Duganella margarita]